MIIEMKPTATDEEISSVVKRLRKLDAKAHILKEGQQTKIIVVDRADVSRFIPWQVMAGVEQAKTVTASFKLASREYRPDDTVINVGGSVYEAAIGSKEIVVMAGPCAVESERQIIETAEAVREAGALIIRGGVFKPRTSPYDFQGLGREGLKLLALAKEKTGLSVITEVMDTRDVELVCQYADILQIGSRNMQNYKLLDEVGKTSKPVMLKRGMSATIESFLLAAERILSGGNPNVILCERGITTFETYTRNTLDLNAVPSLKQLSHLPVIVDPSHGTGRQELVSPMAKAAIAAGADGLLIEVHPNPDRALVDGKQSLNIGQFRKLMIELKILAGAVDRETSW